MRKSDERAPSDATYLSGGAQPHATAVGFDEQLTAWETARLRGDTPPHDAPERADQPIWRALCLLAHESSGYLRSLEQAHDAARTEIDIRLTCAVSMTAAVVDHGTMSHLDVWLARLPGATASTETTAAPEVWLALGDVAAAVLHGAKVAPERPAASATRLFALLDSSDLAVSADTRVTAAQLLLEYAYAVGRFELLDLVISLAEGPGVMSCTLPVVQARWFSCRGYLCFMRADAEGAKRCWLEAHTIAEKNQLRGAAFMAQIGLVRQLLDEQDVAAADAVLANLRPAEGPGRSTQVLLYKHVVARSLLLKEQSNAALMQIEEAIAAAKLLGIVDGELFLLMQQRAEILFANGRYRDAEAQIEWMMERSKDTDQRIHRINLQLLKASGSLSDQPEQRADALRAAFGEARTWNFTRFLRSLPKVASQACLGALQQGIEVSFVTDIVRQRGLRAPSTAGARWPWHVVVKMMGNAQVFVKAQSLKFLGRAQMKPLELLFFLASSRGMRASNELIASTLWSDEDLVRAVKSLETTTARLRRLLGDPSLLQVTQGQTLLDPGRTWSDWLGLMEIATRATEAATLGQRTPERNMPVLSRELLTLYDGAFLVASADTPWVIARRQEAIQLFTVAAVGIHANWPSHAASESVEAFLESALMHEPLSESVALLLMQIYARSDRVADALRVFRHIRHQMSVLLGLTPGKPLEAFAQRLLRGDG